jgi:hypothetical protein
MGRARYSVPSMRFCAPSMPSGGTGARTTLVFRRDQDERPTDEKPIGLLRRFAATSARITLAVQDRAFARPNAGLGYLRRITNASKSRQSRDSKGPDGSNLPPSATQSACFPTLWRSDEIGAWGAIHARRWTRRMPTAAAERENRLKFSVRDFGMSICEPADILRRSVFGRTLPDASNYARVSLSGFQSLLLRTPERGKFDSLGHR